MLGDDVLDGTRKGISIIGHAIGNAAKGALLFGAIAAGVVLLGSVGLAVADGVFTTGAMAEIASEFGAWEYVKSAVSLVAEKAGPHILNALTFGAIGGAVVSGVSSLLPGHDEGYGVRGLFTRKPKVAKTEERAPVIVNPPAQSTHTVYVDREESRTADCPRPQHITNDNSQRTQVIHHESPTYNNYRSDSSSTSVAQNNAFSGQPDAALAAAGAPPQQLAAPENPLYQPGAGTQAMQRGNEKEAAMTQGRP